MYVHPDFQKLSGGEINLRNVGERQYRPNFC
jgi:hypothetical protein